MTLEDFFRDHPKVALGFSGGVDSAYLLHAARQYGADCRAYFVRSPFQPAFELADARRLDPGVTVLELDVLQVPEVAANPANRCYYCKRAIFSALKRQALADGYTVLLDGTNASDQRADRPGMQALEELQVLSPLQLCGLTKAEIRSRSKQAGLFTWNKPAYACLATRIPTGTALDKETLQKVEQAEAALFRLGYSDFRVRVFAEAARIQMKPEQFPMNSADYAALRQAVSPYFPVVLLDLQPR